MTEALEASSLPVVTIGISTYNRADSTFPLALSSALEQSYPRLEVVVCDNASADGTEALMRSQRDSRLRYYRHASNIGAHANFNACLERAQGDYFLLLHDDDLLEPDSVARSIKAIGQRRPGVVLGGTRLIDGQGAQIGVAKAPPEGGSGADVFEAWFTRRCSFYFCSTLFHTETLRKVGGFSTPEGLFEDVAAIAEVIHVASYVSVPVIAGAFRRHDGNRGGATPALRWARESQYLLDRLAYLFPQDADRLVEVGAPFLAAKCYRYVRQVRSVTERWRLYRDLDRRFGYSLPPLRYLVRRAGADLREYIARIRRRRPLAGRNV